MLKTHQIKKNDDFKLAIVFRIEGHNSRAVILRIVGIAVAIVAAGVKIALMFIVRSP